MRAPGPQKASGTKQSAVGCRRGLEILPHTHQRHAARVGSWGKPLLSLMAGAPRPAYNALTRIGGKTVVSENIERRLMAILMADVAGYSRLMGADEEGTLAQLPE